MEQYHGDFLKMQCCMFVSYIISDSCVMTFKTQIFPLQYFVISIQGAFFFPLIILEYQIFHHKIL